MSGKPEMHDELSVGDALIAVVVARQMTIVVKASLLDEMLFGTQWETRA